MNTNLPPELVDKLANRMAAAPEQVSKKNHKVMAENMLNLERVRSYLRTVCTAFNLSDEAQRGLKLLEIGSGIGTLLAVARVEFGLEAYGIEPACDGYEFTKEISTDILKANDLDPDILGEGIGEKLPFPDNHFDLIVSKNVLEHTQDPFKVIQEATRTLKPGGYLYIIAPNYGSILEGHYLIPWLPNQPLGLARLWVRLWGHKTDLLETLSLVSVKKARRWLKQIPELELVSLGEDAFRYKVLEKEMDSWVTPSIIKLVRILKKVKILPLAVKVAIFFDAFEPLCIIARKK